MTEHDKKMGEELLKEPFIQKHPEWVKELEVMMKSGEKAEIQVRFVCALKGMFCILNRRYVNVCRL